MAYILPLNIASYSVCHCTLLARLLHGPLSRYRVILPPVRLSERQRQNWQISDNIESSGKRAEWRMEDRKSHTTAPALPYRRTIKDTTKPPRERETEKKTNKNTFFLCFIVYVAITLSFFRSAPCLLVAESWMT